MPLRGSQFINISRLGADRADHGAPPALARARNAAQLPGHVGLVGDAVVEVVQRLEHVAAVPQHVALDPVRDGLGELVLDEAARGHGEDVVELLERALLGLRHEQEDHDEGQHVEAGVEAEDADGVHDVKHLGQADGEHGRVEEAGGHGPGHADLAVRQREDLGRIGEGNGALARRVKCGEDVDEERNAAKLGVAADDVGAGYQSAQARGQ